MCPEYRFTVLLVEDSEVDRTIVLRRLKAADGFWQCVTATSVAEALEYLQSSEHTLDVALVDWQLPDGFGGRVLEAARALERPVPVVMMTGGGREDVEGTIADGAQDFMSKPIHKHTPLGRILRYAMLRDSHLRLQRERSAAAEAAERNESMARLAAGVAHELSNNLAAISLNIDLIAVEDALPEAISTLLADMRLATDAASARCEQLRVFTGRVAIDDTSLRLAGVVRTALSRVGLPSELAGQAGHDRRASVIRGDGAVLGRLLERILGEAARIGQVGTPVLEFSNPTDAEGVEWVLPIDRDAASERYLRVRVPWSGGDGVAASGLRRRFEPFGEGAHDASLDLVECVGFLRAHQAGLSVVVDGRAGAFELWFRPWERRVATPQAQRKSTGTVQRRRVWAVDDDPMVLRVLTRTLRRHGFEVRPFPDGIDAYSAARGGDDCDLLVTDLLMPGMGGAELVRRLRDDGWTQPVVVVTGFSDDVPQLARVPRTKVLLKPFKTEALMGAVNRFLSGDA